MAPLIKNLTESALKAELDSHLAQDVVVNRRDVKNKNINGNFELITPKDCAGTFEHKVVKKHKTRLNYSIE